MTCTKKGPEAETYLATQTGQPGWGGISEGDWLAARPEGQQGATSSHKASQAGEEPGLLSVTWKASGELNRGQARSSSPSVPPAAAIEEGG